MRRTLTLAALVVAATVTTCEPAAARSRGFEPSDATLACIRRRERGTYRSVSRSGKHRGGYQMDPTFIRSYGVDRNVESIVGWYDDGSPVIVHVNDYVHRWQEAPPALQDEVARNGVRARGLQPWPPARGCR